MLGLMKTVIKIKKLFLDFNKQIKSLKDISNLVSFKSLKNLNKCEKNCILYFAKELLHLIFFLNYKISKKMIF